LEKMTDSEERIVLGIDPGSRVTGYGVIKIKGRQISLVDYGCIRPPANLPLSGKYREIHKGLDFLIQKYEPHCCAVESQFIAKNVQSSLKLGMVKGVALLTASLHEIPIFAYAPSKAKIAVVGHGRASKEQVGGMVKNLLKMNEPPTPEDAADALAIAICHAHMSMNGNADPHLV
jgi:crossover junction endodeoxyribonuclease RuvC